jgi:hypothetical protein
MPGTFLCLSIVAALVGFSYRRLRALRKLARWAAPMLAEPPLRPGPFSESGPSDAPPTDLRVSIADLNEATLELGSQLDQPALVPRSCGKAALSVGVLVALMQAAPLLGSSDVRTWAGPLISLSGGCVGALACSFIGQSAEADARRLREDWNALIRRSNKDVST